MASTYEPIATATSTGQNSFTFSSIPSTYTDLVVIVGSVKLTTDTDSIALYFNNDTASNYSYCYITDRPTGPATGRGANVSGSVNWINSYASSSTVPGQYIINIFDYKNTTTYKTALTRITNTNQGTELFINCWRSTSAINRIDLKVQGTDNFLTGTTVTLYGILAA